MQEVKLKKRKRKIGREGDRHMKAKCIMCGKEEEITKLHKDYKKLAENPKAAFVCESCSLIISKQASRGHVLEKK